MGGYREQSLASWESSATGWAYWSRRLSADGRDVTAWLVDRLELRSHDTVLELAAGTGDTGYEAARRAGVRLITTDFAEAMLEEARRRADELGVEGAEFRVLDAERMELPDASVDGVLCRWGYMLMPDPAAALRETRRVLRPGRRVALATWSSPERNPWGMFGRMLVQRGLLPPPAAGEPGIFALPEAGMLESLLAGAGFTEIATDELELTLTYPDFDGYWEFVSRAAGAVVGVIAALPADEVEELRGELAAGVEPFRASDGSLAFPAAAPVAAAAA